MKKPTTDLDKYDKDKTDIEMQNQLDDENRRVMVNWSDNDFTQ